MTRSSVFRSAGGQVPPGSLWADDRLLAVAGYRELASKFAGCSFENGIYRLHDERSGPRGDALIAELFSQFASRACPFGYDWLGRQFAVDSGRLERGEPLVLLFEPGTGEALEIPFSFAGFHDHLDELREPALAGSFFASWAQANAELLPLDVTQCAGYKVPLFLGGKDAPETLRSSILRSTGRCPGSFARARGPCRWGLDRAGQAGVTGTALCLHVDALPGPARVRPR